MRQGHRKRRKKRGSLNTQGQIPDRRPISERPKAVDKRQELGHWEGDTVVGKSNGSFIATHVERKSRYLLVGKTDDKSAESMNATTRRVFRKIPMSKRKTMTFDNGSKEEIDKAAALINNRPRKCLNYRTPHEVLWSG